MTYPITPESYGSYQWLLREVGVALGYSHDRSTWDHEQEGKVDSFVQRGVMQFYFPPPVSDGSAPHQWSFLAPLASLSLTSGTSLYDLPDDYSSPLGDFTFQSGENLLRVPLVPEAQIRHLNATAPLSGPPKFAAIRSKVLRGSETKHEALFYPTPAQAYTLDFRYTLIPPALSEANPWPLGGKQFAEAVLETCVGVATGGMPDKKKLAAAIQMDQVAKQTASTYPIKAEAHGSYQWLLREVGASLGLGYDRAQWDHEKVGMVESIVQRGYLQFCFPPPVGEEAPPHQWSFLTPLKTLDLASGTSTYELPSDFTGLSGDFTYQSGTSTFRIPLVPESKLRQLFATASQSGSPRYAAIRPKVANDAEQRYEVVFYPTPNESATVEYRHTIVPEPLTETNQWPLGGRQMAEAILESCLSIAQETAGAQTSSERWMRKLSAAIQFDTQTLRPKEEDLWPLENPSVGLSVSKAYLKRLIGRQMGHGPNPGAWTATQLNEVMLALETGLRMFYHPTPLPGERVSHGWSFLRPIYTLSTAEGESTYQLPSDFAMVDGPLLYAPGENALYPEIPLVSEHQVRMKLQANASTGRPYLAATRVGPLESSGATRWEMVLFPTADDTYRISFPYKVNPSMMADEEVLPYGGDPHAQTIVEACLAACEQVKGEQGAHSGLFQERLIASVMMDRQASAPATLGYNTDPSDGPMDWSSATRLTDLGGVTYNGVLW
jgi:hypothetical protein